jgi:UDP-4-amino-4,6-dideoxy-N-acetyl-beta-L-altrosamine transaminase
MIPYGRQDISQEDIDAVVDVLKSDFLTQGPIVPQFERTVAKYVGANYAVASTNATSSLHLACLALDLGPGDLLWTSPITFVASANCARYCGADVDFVDIDPKTYNMCPEKLEEKLEKAALTGRLPKIIIPVHLCGQSCDMKKIGQLARKYGIHVVEDASHAIGGKYDGRPVGSCEHSDITVFSFHPVKIVTTAEGGLATTNDAELAGRMELLRSHGITRDEAKMVGPSEGGWYYQQIELGFNYRMTELQAALGLSQFKRLDKFVEKRNELAKSYQEEFSKVGIGFQHILERAYSAFHLFVIQLPNGDNHKRIFDGLRASGVGVNLHYIPVHLQPYYRALGFTNGDFPNAESYYEKAISLPMFPNLDNEKFRLVVNATLEAYRKSEQCPI